MKFTSSYFAYTLTLLLLFIIAMFFSLSNVIAEEIQFIDTPSNLFGFTFNSDSKQMYYSYFADGAKIFVLGNGTEKVIDLTQNNTMGSNKPLGIAFNPHDHNIYATVSTEDRVYVINGTDNSIINKIKVGPYPAAIAYNPINHHIYVTNVGTSLLTFINTTTNQVSRVNGIESGIFGITYNPANENLYLTTGGIINPTSSHYKIILSNRDSPILVVDSKSNNVIDSIFLNASSFLSAYNPANELMYVTSSKGIFTINSTNNEITEHINPAKFNNSGLLDIAYNPANELMYVTSSKGIFTINSTNNEINKIEGNSDISQPLGISYNPFTEEMNFNDNESSDRFYILDKFNNSSCKCKWVG